MNNLQFYTALTALWVALSWVPYILDRMATRGLMGALANYDPNARPQLGLGPARHARTSCQCRSLRGLRTVGRDGDGADPGRSLSGPSGLDLLRGIVAHYIIYCAGIVVLRTLAFAVAALSTAGLALRVLGAI